MLQIGSQSLVFKLNGSERLDSNQRFPPYEGGEMTTSLLRHIVNRLLRTCGLSARYLFILGLYLVEASLMVRSTRFELVRSRALDPKSSVAAFTPAPQIVTAIYMHRAVNPISVSFAYI